jgi:hypothetical protein
MKIPNNRRGFTPPIESDIKFEREILPPSNMGAVVYWNSKLTHNGVVGYKTFENVVRHVHANSLNNLLTSISPSDWILNDLVLSFRNAKNDDERSRINDQAVEKCDQEQFELFLQKTRQARHINKAQGRKIRNLCDKLAYYTQKRVFRSTKTGAYSMRVAFLTLTAPDYSDPKMVCKAFNHFLDYLQRTANCVYVWKKELGSESERLHFHIVINNFIPYYIISWKWKRLLIAEGVEWYSNEAGKDTDSHYRIELPRNKRQISHYISKYMSKAYDLPGEYGYISGHSSVLNSLREITLIENDCPMDEIIELKKISRVICRDYVTIICNDLLTIKDKCPKLFAIFNEQYEKFSEIITLPQRFFTTEQRKPNLSYSI